MMKSKRSKSSSKHENGVDHISNLPDPILHLILSSLQSTEQAIRTSVLSTRWRYLWTSIPNVDIDCSRALKPFKTNEFEDFVYWVFVNKTLNLDSFRLSCSNYYDMPTVGRWIHLALMRKVKLLHLTFCPSDKNEIIDLPHCLVNCVSLDVLRLFMCTYRLNLSKSTGFGTLKVLELNDVELVDHDLVREFFVSCPLLEDLSLIDCLICTLDFLCISCPELKTLRIDNRRLAYCEFTYYDDDDSSVYRMYDREGLCDRLMVLCPKLVFLAYGGHIANHFSFDVQSLKKSVIYPEYMQQQETKVVEYLGETICELFSGVSRVESLSINHYFVKCLDVKGDYPASLPNLKTLEITIDGFCLNVLISILKCSPNLESLHLIIKEGFSPQEFPTLVRELDELEIRRILTDHLKRVEFLGFTGEKKKLVIAQFLLQHGNALEKMVFSWRDNIKYRKRTIQITNEMSKFYKASSSVKVVNLFNDQRNELFVKV